MAKRKEIIPIPCYEWCSCKDWKESSWRLNEYVQMNFCVFCGKKLVKEKVL